MTVLQLYAGYCLLASLITLTLYGLWSVRKSAHERRRGERLIADLEEHERRHLQKHERRWCEELERELEEFGAQAVYFVPIAEDLKGVEE